ncbi:ATP-binding protein [Pseudophaeobacter flagellatus]|uniref:ATP-binding protein n=1 Tax=Pseudophaeobacter flagellatus TaxID=2899119 RepID=UPI001E39B01B|nr:ATP-binding protein [Pseudophaeobacter flagellatus]MCD9146506.1 ATP-binding protein [Pseudophaeobacter flagellatus]
MQRWAGLLGFALAVIAIGGATWVYGYRQALDSLAERSVADLALASDRVSTQLQIYQELAVLMADHPALEQLDSPAGRRAAQHLLRGVADKTAALDVLYADVDGRVLTAASGVLGENIAAEGYFRRALQGALGTGAAVLADNGQRAYFYAAPDFSPEGGISGVLVVVADVEDVEQTWRGSLPAVFFTKATGEVFISNRPELLFWQQTGSVWGAAGTGGTGGVLRDGSSLSYRVSTTGEHEIWHLSERPYLPRRALHLTVGLPVIGLTGQILVDVASAWRLATLQAFALAALCLAFGTFLFLALERRRTLAKANAVLESRVATRTRALQATNSQLRREVSEREDAEAALKKAQEELVQAGKLSALGQMSAGISHELNQPLMAIQQYAENGDAFLRRGQVDRVGENLTRIAGMSARMARIIKNLRAFSRNENEPMARVDLVQVINTAVELTASRLETDEVALSWQPPDGNEPIYVWGGEVRLTQVFVNLINNSADAMLDQNTRSINITLEAGDRLSVAVRDIGPGIKEPEKMFDPFYSTKVVSSSEGMGLGLSISYGLVQSFGGNIHGRNMERGAVFTVELERWNEGGAT